LQRTTLTSPNLPKSVTVDLGLWSREDSGRIIAKIAAAATQISLTFDLVDRNVYKSHV